MRAAAPVVAAEVEVGEAVRLTAARTRLTCVTGQRRRPDPERPWPHPGNSPRAVRRRSLIARHGPLLTPRATGRAARYGLGRRWRLVAGSDGRRVLVLPAVAVFALLAALIIQVSSRGWSTWRPADIGIARTTGRSSGGGMRTAPSKATSFMLAG